MSVFIVSQDKKAMWDYNKCVVAITNDLAIVIRPYDSEETLLLGHYKDPETTQKVFNDLIKACNNFKLFIKPKGLIKLQDLEVAKRNFEELNKIDIIATDSMFDTELINNNGNVVFQMPEDNAK